MAIKEFWVGDRGPFEYDDEDEYLDDNDESTGEAIKAFKTSGKISTTYDGEYEEGDFVPKGVVEGVVSGSFQMVSVANIVEPIELMSVGGDAAGAIAVAFRQRVGGIDRGTIYLFDPLGAVGEMPFVVPAVGGAWVALCGQYSVLDGIVNANDVTYNTLSCFELSVRHNPEIPASGRVHASDSVYVGPNKIIGLQQPSIANPILNAITNVAPTQWSECADRDDVPVLQQNILALRTIIVDILRALRTHGLIAS